MGDADGHLYILGRMTDVIHTKDDSIIVPREVEEVFYQHASVGQVAAVGLSHNGKSSQTLVVWVTPKAGSPITHEELISHCDAQGSAIPDVLYVSNAPLPLVAGDKIAKKTLQDPVWVRQRLAKSFSDALRRTEVACLTADSWKADAIRMFDLLDVDGSGSLDIIELESVFGRLTPTDAGDLLGVKPSEACSARMLASRWFEGLAA